MKVFRLCFLALLLCYAYTIHAAAPGNRPVNPVKARQFINHSEWIPMGKDWSFVENKGQLADQNGHFQSEIKYYGHSQGDGQGGVYLYCKPGMLSFVFTKTVQMDPLGKKTQEQISEATGMPVSGVGVQNPEPLHRKLPQPSKVSTARTDLILVGSNPNAQIIATDRQEYYENFYLAYTPEEGITNVHTYKTVIYKSIYPNIDMVLQVIPSFAKASADEEGMEYSFIVHPGGKVGDIQLQWNGLEGTKALTNGGFKYSNSLGTLEESAPKSFAEGKLVPSSFIRNGFRYGFKVGRYDKEKDLVIDPSLVWATYYGGSGGQDATGVTADKKGNVYIAGSVSGTDGIATSGSYQSTFAGSYDGFLAKFDSSGKYLKWGTYYGGSSYDYVYGLSCDSSCNLFIGGSTESSSGIASSGAFSTSLTGGGSYDNAFLAKFDSTGHRKWGSYFGGSEGLNVQNDKAGNVYFSGTTGNAIVTTSGAYQTSYGGSGDIFLTKFSSSGSLIWSTYYGGSGPESQDQNSLAVDSFSNVYITGITQSTKGIATSGAYQTSYSGSGVLNYDCFLAKFDKSGSLKWSTYFGGSGDDQSSGVYADLRNNVYITGSTSSSSKIATSGAYMTSYSSANYGCFLANFNGAGGIEWATYYQGTGHPYDYNSYGYAICGDTLGNIFIAGRSNYPSGIATSGAYQSYTGSNGSAFLTKFRNNGSVAWGTYLGNGGSFYNLSITGFNSKFIYLASGGQLAISATTGAYQTIPGNNGSYDMTFLTKFLFPTYQNDIRIDSLKSPISNICPGNQKVKVNIANYGLKEIDSVKIGWSINSKLQSPYNWKGKLKFDSSVNVNIGNYSFIPGTDTIKVWAFSPNGVVDSTPENDSITAIIKVNAAPSAKAVASQSICKGLSISIGATSVSGDTYSWSSSPSGFSSTSSNPSVSPTSTTTYILAETITSTGCSKTDSVTITVNALPSASVISSTAICPGSTISIGATAVTGDTYSWSSSVSGFSSTVSNPSVSPTSTTTYTLTETNSNGCVKSNLVQITVSSPPTASVISNTAICTGSAISIGAATVTGHKYSWSSSVSGFSSTVSNPSVSPTSTASYTLTETNSTGCSKSNSVNITVNPLPAASVISNTAICAGSAISIGATAVTGSTYSWASSVSGYSSTVANPSVSPTSTSSYTLTETNSNGCMKSNSVTITANPLPSASVISNTAICPGSAISIGTTAVSGHTYSWSSSVSGFSSTVSNPSVSPTSTSSYTLTETNSNGCVKSNSVTITVNTLPAASVISNTAVCAGSAISIGAAAVSGSVYSWASSVSGFSSTVSNPSVSPTSTASYTLTETNSNGCVKSNSVTITVNPLPSASVISNTAICAGSAISIGAAAVTGSAYSWASSISGFSSTVANPSVSPTSTSSYTLTETNSNGCVKSNSVTITINPLPSASVISNTAICAGSAISIGAAAVSGSAYSWASSVSGFSSTSANPSVSPTSTSSYTLTETNLNECVKSNSVTITINPLPSASVISNIAICTGSAISIGAAAVSGSTYSWVSSVSGYSSTSANPSVSPTSDASYTLTETNLNGCVKSNSVTVTVNSLPSASVISNTAICSGSAISVGSTAVTGSHYLWASSVSGFSSTLSNPSVSPTSTSSYTLTETNSNSCVQSNSVTITVNPLPSASVISNTAICSGLAIPIGAAAVTGDNYLWASSPTGYSSTLSNPSVNPASTTSYTLTETLSATGCSASNSVTITVNPLPSASVIPNTAICAGSAISIGATAVTGSSYSWTSSVSGFSSTVSNPSVSPTSTGSYTLTETNSNGCVKSNAVTITVNPLPAASVISNTAICTGSAISIGAMAVPGSSYSWASSVSGFSSTSANPSVSPKSNTKYYLTETNVYSCISSDSVFVTVNPLPEANWIATVNELEVAFVPKNTTYKSYLWHFGDGDSSIILGPVYDYNKKGLYQVALKITDDNGCSNEHDSVVNITYSSILKDIQNEFSISVFPNPFHASVTILYTLPDNSDIRLSLYDLNGKLIGIIADQKQIPGSYQLDVNAEKYHLNPGVYLLKFMVNGTMENKKVVLY